MIVPDWSETYSSSTEAEQDLSGFTFEGFGWYLGGGDTLLIRELEEGHVIIDVWNSFNAHEALTKTLSLPIIEEATK